MNTETHTCNCKVCNGITITTPVGYISGTPKTVATEVHNYAQMTRSPVMGPVMAARGVMAV